MQGAVKQVQLVEVGPRDGLQNEAVLVSTADKVALIRRLGEAKLLDQGGITPIIITGPARLSACTTPTFGQTSCTKRDSPRS